MTDTVHPNKKWITNDSFGNYQDDNRGAITIPHAIFNEHILVITLDPIHEWNRFDKENGTNLVYQKIVSLIQVAQTQDIECKLKFIVLDNSIESMSFFNSPNKPNCPSSIITELTDDFSNDGYKFIWLTGNANAERNHKLWCRLNNVDVNESWVLQRDTLAETQTGQPNRNRVKRHEKPEYLATCLNRFAKPHRLKMLDALLEKNALDLQRIKVTMPTRTGDPEEFKGPYSSVELQRFLPIPLVEANEIYKGNNFIQWNWRQDEKNYEKFLECFRNSYFDIVSETFNGDFHGGDFIHRVVNYPFLQNFVTEKTWRCFHWRRPFLLNAEQDSIKHLHDLGFKTFGDFWDESYASLATFEQRTEAIADIVADMLTWNTQQLVDVFDSSKMQDILDHNEKVFHKHARKNALENMLPKVYSHNVSYEPFEFEKDRKYLSPNYNTELYRDHLIIAPQKPLVFFNNEALDELFNIVQMLGEGKTIVFDQSLEAIDKYQGNISTPFHLMHLLCDRFDLDDLIYIDGNANVQINYDNWCEYNNIKPFMTCHYLHVFAKMHKDVQPHITADFSTPMKYYANCMNMIPKRHRAEMLSTLHLSGWFTEKLKWTWHTAYGGSLGEEWFQHNLGLLEVLPLSGPDDLLSAKNNLHVQWEPKLNKKLHKFIDVFADSYIDIIGESHSFYDSENGFSVMFPTEKTWRSIQYGKPFVINGPKFSIKHLQDLGFRTFSDYWSEDYDQWGGNERCEGIRDSIKPYMENQISLYETCSSAGMRDILQHNQQLFNEYAEQQTPYWLIDNVL